MCKSKQIKMAIESARQIVREHRGEQAQLHSINECGIWFDDPLLSGSGGLSTGILTWSEIENKEAGI